MIIKDFKEMAKQSEERYANSTAIVCQIILVTIIAVITCFVFQGTVFAFLGFSEVVPNLCLILATSLGAFGPAFYVSLLLL